MAVRIRMKRMGRRNRPFFRICAMDARAPRDGKIIEELGTYDPLIPDTDQRVVLDQDRVRHWLSVGAQPTEKVAVLLKKYGQGLWPRPASKKRSKSQKDSKAKKPKTAKA